MQEDAAVKLPELRDESYSPEYPEGSHVDENIKTHLVRYYTAVDTAGGHQAYALSFAQDAVLTLPTGIQVRGREGKVLEIYLYPVDFIFPVQIVYF